MTCLHFPRLTFGLLWVLSSSAAASPIPCHTLRAQAAESGGQSAFELFDPASLLISKGIDPKRVTGRVEDGGPGDAATTLQIIVDGVGAGYLTMLQEIDLNGRPYPTISKVEVKADFQGKGLGSILYIAANRIAVERYKLPLHRSELTSIDAKRTWKRFVDLEYAQLTHDEYGGEVVAFRPAVAATAGSKAAEEIFQRK